MHVVGLGRTCWCAQSNDWLSRRLACWSTANMSLPLCLCSCVSLWCVSRCVVWLSCGLDGPTSVRAGLLLAKGIERAFDQHDACFLYDQRSGQLFFDCAASSTKELVPVQELKLNPSHIAWMKWDKLKRKRRFSKQPVQLNEEQRKAELETEDEKRAALTWLTGRKMIKVSDCRRRPLMLSEESSIATPSSSYQPSTLASTTPGSASLSSTNSTGPSKALLSTHAMATRARWRRLHALSIDTKSISSRVSTEASVASTLTPTSGSSRPTTSSSSQSPRAPSVVDGERWVEMIRQQRIRGANGEWAKQAQRGPAGEWTACYYLKSTEKQHTEPTINRRRKPLPLKLWEKEERDIQEKAVRDARKKVTRETENARQRQREAQKEEKRVRH